MKSALSRLLQSSIQIAFFLTLAVQSTSSGGLDAIFLKKLFLKVLCGVVVGLVGCRRRDVCLENKNSYEAVVLPAKFLRVPREIPSI